MKVLEFKKKENPFGIHKENMSKPHFPQGISPVGIDLGTTNSVVSIFSPGQAKPQTLSYEGSHLVPSLLYFDKNENKILIGAQAKAHLKNDTSQVIASTKRSMGAKKQSTFESNGQFFSAEEAATLILGYLASHPTLQAEKEKFGGLWAVITVPAHFDDAARTATLLAAKEAGIHVLRIINEPTAAALAYSLLEESRKVTTENLVVFDFGGGTFDVSVVDRHELTFNVLSSEGNVHLGGDDVDEAIAEHFISHVQPPFVARRSGKDSDLYRKIYQLAQEAKKTLQTEAHISLNEANIDGKGSSLQIELDRQQFEDMVFPILEKTVYLTENALQSARKSPKNISRILLVGGSTRLLLIRKMLTDYFDCLVDARLEPDLAVSWGASLQAAIIAGIHVETILVDVCSHSLGVGVVESTETAHENFKTIAKKYGLKFPFTDEELHTKLGKNIDEFNQEVQGLLKVATILYRNSPLPARKSEFFNTVYHNQAAVHVVVVQGEEETVGENRLIGSFLFLLEQPCPKGSRCEIQLTYDANGMVHVFAKQLGTSNEARANFDSRTGVVEGWSPLTNLPENPPFIETPEKKPTSVSSEVPLQDTISIPSLYSHDTNFKEIIPVNAIALRAKRVLSKIGETHAEFQPILTLAKEYSALIDSEKNGEEHGEKIEVIEEKLLSFLEGKP